MGEEHRLGVFENRVLKIFGPKGDEVIGNREDYITRRFLICDTRQILFGRLNQEE